MTLCALLSIYKQAKSDFTIAPKANDLSHLMKHFLLWSINLFNWVFNLYFVTLLVAWLFIANPHTKAKGSIYLNKILKYKPFKIRYVW